MSPKHEDWGSTPYTCAKKQRMHPRNAYVVLNFDISQLAEPQESKLCDYFTFWYLIGVWVRVPIMGLILYVLV